MLVSILIPAFNRESHLEACVRSALAQTYKNIEIIIVDNCSTDKTWEICKKLVNLDKRIQIYKNSSNIGPIRNWRKCLDISSGEYIKVLFSDDLLDPYCVEKMVSMFSDKVGFVFSKAKIFKNNPQQGVIRYDLGKTGNYTSEDFIYGSIFEDKFPVSPGAAIFRKRDFEECLIIDIPNRIDSDFSDHGIGPDLILFLLVIRNYSHFAYVNEILSYFRDHDGSISSDSGRSRRVLYYSLAKCYFVLNHYPQLEELFYAYIKIIILIFRHWDFGKRVTINDFFEKNKSIPLSIYLKAIMILFNRYFRLLILNKKMT